MNFINNSQDILFLVLAFCALWLTAFLIWLLWYIIMSAKQAYQVIDNFKKKIESVEELIDLLKDKLSSSTSYLSLIITGVKKITEILNKKSDSRKRSSKR